MTRTFLDTFTCIIFTFSRNLLTDLCLSDKLQMYGRIKAAMQQRLTMISGQLNVPVQTIDTFPLPVCVRTRTRRDRCFPTEADFRYCADKEMHYYGLKLVLCISRLGMITYHPLLPDRPQDIQSMDAFLDGFVGTSPVNKWSSCVQSSLLLNRHGVIVATPQRKNIKTQLPEPFLQF